MPICSYNMECIYYTINFGTIPMDGNNYNKKFSPIFELSMVKILTIESFKISPTKSNYLVRAKLNVTVCRVYPLLDTCLDIQCWTMPDFTSFLSRHPGCLR